MRRQADDLWVWALAALAVARVAADRTGLTPADLYKRLAQRRSVDLDTLI